MTIINDLTSYFSLTCNKLLSVKIGCGRKMERNGNEDDDDTDSDDGYEDEETGKIDNDGYTKWRGCHLHQRHVQQLSRHLHVNICFKWKGPYTGQITKTIGGQDVESGFI